MAPSTGAPTVAPPQASVALALPRAPLIADVDGLQPSGASFPVAVIVGAVISNVHVAVRDALAVLPQASVAVNVRVWLRKHPLLCIGPSEVDVTVAPPQPSAAVAEPNAALITDEEGLQPRAPLPGVPVAVTVGGVKSNVQVAVRDVAAVFPHASVAVNVLVCERRHPLLCTTPSDVVTVGLAHASVALAEPSAALIADDEGLQPNAPFAGVPVAVIVGGVLSVQIFIANGAIKSFNSAVGEAEDFVFMNIEVNGSARQGVPMPFPNNAVMSRAPSTNINESG